MNVIVSFGVGVLIFIVDKRQSHYLDEIIQTQHKLTQEIHSMITEEMRLINEMRRENNKGCLSWDRQTFRGPSTDRVLASVSDFIPLMSTV